MKTFKLVIEYDGTDFVGWQVQPNGRSVQGVLQAALAQLTGSNVSVIGAGRTDAGVHARGQVAHIRVETALDAEAILHGLNSLLPEDVVVHDVVQVDNTFHARYSARERTYRYIIVRHRTAIDRRIAWYVKYRLNVELMQKAASMILGVHDFRSFAAAKTETKNFHCTVTYSEWIEVEDKLVYEIRSNRFLHGMVRALVGTMVDIGRGHIALEEFPRILESRNRSRAGISAPAHGLVLESVRY